MKLFDVSWLEIFAGLEAWSTLERNQKLALLKAKPSGDQALEVLQGEHETFEAAGLIHTRTQSHGARAVFCITEEWRAGQIVVRAMHRSRVLDAPLDRTQRHRALLAYLGEHYSEFEVEALTEQPFRVNRRYLAEQVADFSWVESFLDPDDARYQTRKLRLDATPPGEVEMARRLVRLVVDRGAPIRTADLVQPLGREALAQAIDLGLGEVLLFAALDEDLEPIVGLWPSTLERLAEGPPELRTFEKFAGASFAAPFLIHDAVTVLVACLAEPARLKADFHGMYARDQRRIENQLAPLPDWFGWQEQHFGNELYSPEKRVADAVRFATELALAESRGMPSRDYRLEVTDLGRTWLAEAESQRHEFVCESAREQLPWPGDSGEARPQPDWNEFNFFPGLRTYGLRVPVTRGAWQRALIQAYLELADQDIVLLGEFLKERARAHNPFKNRSSERIRHPQPEQALETLWANTLFHFFQERLLPLGAVEIGFVSGDKTLAFRLTQAGRYLLGETDDFPETDQPLAAEVIVQPNFEIVFLAPSVEAEARLMSFAEQSKSRSKGSRVGLLFELTRESVLRGAVGGLNGDAMVETLRQLSTSELPENVDHQVRAWAKQVRTLEGRQTFLLECPDKETANRAQAALGKKGRVISDTVLEVETGLVLSMALRKKLREAGLFVRERESD